MRRTFLAIAFILCCAAGPGYYLGNYGPQTAGYGYALLTSGGIFGGNWTGSLNLTGQNSPYTATQIYQMAYPGVTFTDTDQTVSYVPSGFLQNQTTGKSCYIVDDAAVSSGLHNGVCFFGVAVADVNNASVWGINTLLTDSQTQSPSSGTGRNLTNELDFNVTSSGTGVVGLKLTGASSASPSSATGFDVAPLGLNGGLHPWLNSFMSENGAATNTLVVGYAGAQSGANLSSQSIIWNWTDSSSNAHYITQSVNGGTMNFSNSSGNANIHPSGALDLNNLQPISWYNNASALSVGIYGDASNNLNIRSLGSGASVQIQDSSGANVVEASTGLVKLSALLQLQPYTVSTLPACNSSTSGDMARVTDATAPAYDGSLTGGGTVGIPVFCDGTAWTAH